MPRARFPSARPRRAAARRALSGRAIVVTGGARGIGRAIVLDLIRQGARVAIGDQDVEAGQALVSAIVSGGGVARFREADVARSPDVDALIADAVGAFGRLDGAVNNAGILGAVAPLHRQGAVDFDRTFLINLKGVWSALRAEIHAMLPARTGSIVNLSSVNGLRTAMHAPLYSASKFAVMGLTKSAALEFGPVGLRINAICPGPIGTEMLARSMGSPHAVSKFKQLIPLRRVGRADEVAKAVSWLLSDEAGYINGHALVIDGGLLAGV